MEGKKRILTVAVAVACSLPTASAVWAQTQSQAGDSSAQAEQVMKDWKEKPRKVAQDMMRKYGPPDEVTAERMIWHDTGPWKRTELINEEIDHKFPLPHKDMLLQVVDYDVPADKLDDIAAFDGSVIVERTRGELGARCDKEAANLLAVNLAQEIATDKRTTEEARKIYTEQIIAFANDQQAPLMKELKFEAQKDAGDPGQVTMDESTIKDVKEKMKAMD